MPYESPYQSMVENEVLFQQQPWLKRIPHQIRHAVTPVSDALTGTGAGLIAGTALGSPRAGAAIGGILGGLHGVLAHNPTPAQEWAYNNPELVHVLKARAAYDAGGGFEMGKEAALKRLGLEKVAISKSMVTQAVRKRIADRGKGAHGLLDSHIFQILDPFDENSNMHTEESKSHPAVLRGETKGTARHAKRRELRDAAEHAMRDAHEKYTERRRERLGGTPIGSWDTMDAISELGGPAKEKWDAHAQAARDYHMQQQLPSLEAANAALPADPALKPKRIPERWGDTSEGILHLQRQEAESRRASEVLNAESRAARAEVEQARAASAQARARAAAIPSPTKAPPSGPAAPTSNLRRNLTLGAAVALPTLAYTAYRHFTKKPETEDAHTQGKTAMLRTLGF